MQTTEALRIFANLTSEMQNDVYAEMNRLKTGEEYNKLKEVFNDMQKLRDTLHIAMLTWPE